MKERNWAAPASRSLSDPKQDRARPRLYSTDISFYWQLRKGTTGTALTVSIENLIASLCLHPQMPNIP